MASRWERWLYRSFELLQLDFAASQCRIVAPAGVRSYYDHQIILAQSRHGAKGDGPIEV